jgi:hypothetical protein
VGRTSPVILRVELIDKKRERDGHGRTLGLRWPPFDGGTHRELTKSWCRHWEGRLRGEATGAERVRGFCILAWSGESRKKKMTTKTRRGLRWPPTN